MEDTTDFEDPTLPVDFEKSANPNKLDHSIDVCLENYTEMSSTLPLASVSPMRAKTMKEYDKQIADFKKENFNLKLRIYFLEDKLQEELGFGNQLQINKTNLELKVKIENMKVDMQTKTDLLSQASHAWEALEKQHLVKMQELQEKFSKEKGELEEQIHSLSSKLEAQLLNGNMNTSQADKCIQEKDLSISKLEEEIKRLKEQSLKSIKTIQGFYEIVQSKEEKISALSKKLTRANKDCTEEDPRDKNRPSFRKSDCCDSKSRVAELRTVLDKFEEEAKISAGSHAKICTEKDSMIEQLQKSLQNLQSSMERKLTENINTEDVQKVDKVIVCLQDKIRDQQMQLEEFKCEKKLCDDENQEKLFHLEDKMDKLQKDLADSEKSRKYFEKKCSEMDSELKSSRTLITAKEQEILILRQTNSDLSAAQQNADAVDDDNGALREKALQNAKDEVETVKTRLVKSKKENDFVNSLLKEKEKELDDAESKRLALAYKLSSMEELINELTVGNRELGDGEKSLNPRKKVGRETIETGEQPDERQSRNNSIGPANSEDAPISADQGNMNKDEINDLKEKSRRYFLSCHLLQCHLEELSNFLQSLISSKYNGQLTPQQVVLLHRFAAESLDLSHNLSKTLNDENQSALAAQLALEDSVCLPSPFNRSEQATTGGQILHRKLAEELVSTERPRRAEHSFHGEVISIDPLPMKYRDRLPTWNSSNIATPQLYHRLESLKEITQKFSNQLQDAAKDSASDSDVWSEPDRNVSQQRIGLDSSVLHPPRNQCKSSTTGDNKNTTQNSFSSIAAKGNEKSKVDVSIIKRLYTKLKNLQHLNNSLKTKISVYDDLEGNVSSSFMSKHMEVVLSFHEMLGRSIETNESLQETLNKIYHDGKKNIYNSNLIEEIAKYEAKAVKHEADYKQVCSANAELQEKLIRKSQELDLEKSSLSEVSKKLSDCENAMALLKSSNERLEMEGQNLQVALSQLASMKKNVSALRDDILEKETKLNELNLEANEKVKQLKQVQDWNLALQSEIHQNGAQIKKFEADIKALIDENCKKDEELEETKATTLEMRESLKGKDERIGLLENTNEEFVRKMNEFNIKEQEQILKIKSVDEQLASKSEITSRNLDTREVSTETSESFLHAKFRESSDSLHQDATEKEELQRRVSSFLEDKRSTHGSSIKQGLLQKTLQSTSENERFNKYCMYGHRTASENHHNSTHYSSPDLGIESDPNNPDGKDYVHFSVDEQLPGSNSKYCHPSVLGDITNFTEVESRSGSLFVSCPLFQHELLKKEIGESLITVSGMQSRVKDVAKAFAKNTPSKWVVEQGAMKTLEKNCKNITLCLEKSIEVVQAFSIFDLSSLQESLMAGNMHLNNKNRLLHEELNFMREKSRAQKEDLDVANHKLSAVERKKRVMEKAITKQLHKTNMVLHQAKTNLEAFDA